MATSAPPSNPDFRPIERRISMFGVALVLLVMALGCFLAPRWLAIPAQRLLGYLLIVGAILETIQVLLGHTRFGAVSKGTMPFIVSAILHSLAGVLLICWPGTSAWLFGVILTIAIAMEGLLIVYLSYRLRSVPVRLMVAGCGAVSLFVVGYAVSNLGSESATQLIGYLFGIKLLMLTGLFGYIALFASDEQLRRAYGGAIRPTHPEVGGIYAVFYGPAFHCGVYVDRDEVVDFLTDCKVRQVTWDQFLLGRQPQLWDYPDVPAGPPEEIAAFARGLVGTQQKYHALFANCENVAIYCRSLGKVHKSAYSQASVGVDMIRKYPFLGSLLQLLSRGASWLTYMLGGFFGRRIAFYPIWLSHQVTDWLIVRHLHEKSRPN